ncbi:hypothetical protein LIA77_02576 [Sarocladium implicatum]|nr:hypothetical protein LIA77_02576 [Sarocladium implicatum]
MTSSQPDDVEILVHISAPSRVVDDAGYRQLAQAYLDFKPQRAISLPSPKHHNQKQLLVKQINSHHGAASGRSQQSAIASSSQSYATPAPVPLLLDSQDLSFQSALDNRESPRLGDTTTNIPVLDRISLNHEDEVTSQRSWQEPPSEIADSYPMPHPSLLRNSPSKILQRFLGSYAHQPLNEVPKPALNPTFDKLSQSRDHIEVPSSPIELQIEVPSSQPELPPLPTIPSSPPAPIHGHVMVPLSHEEDPGEDELQIVPTSDDVMDVTHISNSFIDVGSGSAAGHNTQIQPPQSDDVLDVTHISGSLIEDCTAAPASQKGALVHAAAGDTDPMNVTRISGSTFNDDPNIAHEACVPGSSPKGTPLLSDVPNGSANDQPEVVASQKRRLAVGEPVDEVEVTRISSSSFEVVDQESDSSRSAKRRRGSRSSSLSSTTKALNEFIPAVGPKANKTPTSSMQSLSFEIIPPSPPAGLQTLEPADLIPPQLAKLAHDLSSRYRPSSPSRPIDPLERGYWLLDYALWPSPARDSTWAFLERYVSSGLAGWGLWCKRNEDGEGRWVRVYCWGCAVKHAFLLLYLASERRLKGTGAVWVDAEGEVVVQVPAQTK